MAELVILDVYVGQLYEDFVWNMKKKTKNKLISHNENLNLLGFYTTQMLTPLR